MKNSQFFHFLRIFTVTLLFSACVKDPVPPSLGAYDMGVFVTCEGPFGSGTGTMSYYDRSKGGITNNIFALENSNATVGNVLQSFSIYDGKGYMVVNNANRIVVVDAAFKFVDTIVGLSLPRYFLGVGGNKAYVSEWGKDGVTGSVRVLDVATRKIIKTIPTGKGAERMIKQGNRLYVCNNGGFDRDSTVAIIDTDNDVLLSKIPVGVNPSSIVLDSNNDIWVLAGGSYLQATGSKLSKIRSSAVISSFDVPKFASNLTLDNAKNVLYYLAENSIYKKDISTAATPSVFLKNSGFGYSYGLGFDALTNDLYLGDAKDFKSGGTMYVVNTANASIKDSVKVGIAPNGFLFK